VGQKTQCCVTGLKGAIQGRTRVRAQALRPATPRAGHDWLLNGAAAGVAPRLGGGHAKRHKGQGQGCPDTCQGAQNARKWSERHEGMVSVSNRDARAVPSKAASVAKK
jgi:hypothetical protein